MRRQGREMAKKRKTKTKRDAVPKKRERLDPALRRARILDSAARLIARQGYLPIHMGELAREFEGSKALVYAYFPTPGELYNAVLAREIVDLRARGLDAILQDPD